jgi:Uma2 family endonuclease
MITTLETPLAPMLYTDGDLIFPLAEDGDAEDLFQQVCSQFDNKKIEQDAQGNVLVMAPTGTESSDQNSELNEQLRSWAKKDGRGRAFDSHATFILPNSSKRSPDASWVSYGKLKTLTHQQLRKFPNLVPEFIVEIKSPSDRYSRLQSKMEEYLENGVTLGWLIHPDKQTVAIYRQGKAVEILVQPQTLVADAPVDGFVLDLKPIWQGLNF